MRASQDPGAQVPLSHRRPKCSNDCDWTHLFPLDQYWVCEFALPVMPPAARRGQRASPGEGTRHPRASILWSSGCNLICAHSFTHTRSSLRKNLRLIKQEMCHPTQLCPVPYSLIKGSHYRKEIETSLRGRGRQDSSSSSAPSSNVGAQSCTEGRAAESVPAAG